MRFPISVAAPLSAIAVAAAALDAQQGRVEPIALRNVTLIDVETGERRAGRTLVLRDGRIAAVLAAEAAVPTDVRAVDGTGKYVIPGLWDMHTHITREADLALLVAHGVTGTRIMWGTPAVLAWRARIANGDLLGPTIVTAGRIIEGPPPAHLVAVIDTVGRGMVRTAADGMGEVRAQKAAGFDFIKVYNNVSADAYAAIIEEARRLGMPVAGHVPFAVGLGGALAARQSSVEHMRGYVELLVPRDAPQQPGADLRSRALAWRFADTTRVSGLARETRDAGAWNTITLGTRIYESPQHVVDRYLASPDTAYMSRYLKESLRDRKRIPWLSNYTASDFVDAVAGHAAQDRLIRALNAAGARILAGTDIGPWGPSLHRELQYMHSAGLSPLEVLRAATINPARYLGVADSVGSLRPGFRADVVVLDADPLVAIENTRRIHAVVLRGRLLERPALDEILRGVRGAP